MGSVIYHLSGVKDFSKRIVCKSEPEVHFYRKLLQFQNKVRGFRGRALTP